MTSYISLIRRHRARGAAGAVAGPGFGRERL